MAPGQDEATFTALWKSFLIEPRNICGLFDRNLGDVEDSSLGLEAKQDCRSFLFSPRLVSTSRPKGAK